MSGPGSVSDRDTILTVETIRILRHNERENSMTRILNITVVCSLAAALGFAFLNCENHSLRSGNMERFSARVQQEGGGVYDGKIYRSLLSEACANGEASSIEVLVKNKSATLIREGCTSLQTPVDYASLSLMAHNDSQAIFRSQILTEESSPVANLLCRGSETRVFSDRSEINVIDIVFRPDSTRPKDNFIGEVKLGIYDESGANLIAAHSSEDVLVVRSDTKPAGLMAYNSRFGHSSLQVVLNELKADGSYTGIAVYNFDALTSVAAPANPGPSARPPTGSQSSDSTVRGLHVTCYPEAAL